MSEYEKASRIERSALFIGPAGGGHRQPCDAAASDSPFRIPAEHRSPAGGRPRLLPFPYAVRPAPGAVRGRAGLCRHAAVRRGARLHLSGFRHRGHSSLDPPRAVGPELGLCIRSRGADRNEPAFQVGKPARGLRAESADRRAAVSPAGRLHERRLRHGRAARAVARGYRPGAAADRLGDSDGACGSVVGMAQIARAGCAGGGDSHAGQRIGDGLVADGPAVAGGAVFFRSRRASADSPRAFSAREACCSTPG